jgi:hypothetical protein
VPLAYYEKAVGPKELVILDGSAHAQFLSATDARDPAIPFAAIGPHRFGGFARSVSVRSQLQDADARNGREIAIIREKAGAPGR